MEIFERAEAERIKAEMRAKAEEAARTEAERRSEVEEACIAENAEKLKQRGKPLRRRLCGQKWRGGSPQQRQSMPNRRGGKTGK